MSFLYADGHSDTAPVWIALHGSGRDETDMPALVGTFAPKDAVMALRGSVRCDGGFAFFRRNPDRSYEDAELTSRAVDIEVLIRDLGRDRFSGRDLFLFGCSNGAVMGAALLLRGFVGVCGAVLLRPAPPFRDPPAGVSLDIPVLLLEGQADTRRRQADAGDLAGQLRRCGARVCHWTIQGGHAPTSEDHRVAAFWRHGLT